jgi:hypothetical protein
VTFDVWWMTSVMTWMMIQAFDTEQVKPVDNGSL